LLSVKRRFENIQFWLDALSNNDTGFYIKDRKLKLPKIPNKYVEWGSLQFNKNKNKNPEFNRGFIFNKENGGERSELKLSAVKNNPAV